MNPTRWYARRVLEEQAEELGLDPNDPDVEYQIERETDYVADKVSEAVKDALSNVQLG